MAKESDKIIKLREQLKGLNLRSRDERNIRKAKKKHKKRNEKVNKKIPKREEYKQLLKNPLWRNKRKEILLRDNNKCIKCGDRNNLHIHHIKYIGKPWECPNEFLVTLCKDCHKDVHKKISKLT